MLEEEERERTMAESSSAESKAQTKEHVLIPSSNSSAAAQSKSAKRNTHYSGITSKSFRPIHGPSIHQTKRICALGYSCDTNMLETVTNSHILQHSRQDQRVNTSISSHGRLPPLPRYSPSAHRPQGDEVPCASICEKQSHTSLPGTNTCTFHIQRGRIIGIALRVRCSQQSIGHEKPNFVFQNLYHSHPVHEAII